MAVITSVLSLLEQILQLVTALIKKLHSSSPDLGNELKVWEDAAAKAQRTAIGVNDLGAGNIRLEGQGIMLSHFETRQASFGDL